MKILFIATSFSRYDSRIFYKQATALAKLGHSITILCSDQQPKEVIGSITIISTKKPLNRRLLRFLFSYKIISDAIKNVDFDIVQINSPENLLLVKKFKKNGKKVIFDSREDYPAYISEKHWIPIIFRKLVARNYEKYENKIIENIDAIITATPYLAEKMEKKHPHVYMVTNYPIISEMTMHNRNNNSKDLCFYGYSSGDDMHFNVLKAISNIPDTRYHLLLGNNGKHANSIIKLAKKLHIGDRVFIYNRVPFKEIPIFLEKGAAGIVLKRYAANYGYKRGSLGVIKFFDYMANGLPVICTDFDEWKTIVEKYRCGLYVNPYDVTAIQHAIEQIVNFPESTKVMGDNARKAVEIEFNWATQEKKYLLIFTDLNK